MYLLDTHVISEIRKGNRANTHLIQWARAISSRDMYLSVVTIMEIKMAILSVERRDKAQADILNTWFSQQILPTFSGRILEISLPIALHCAALHVPDPRSDRVLLIAATAMVHGLTVVTRNIADFRATGVALLNPWR